ncbi:hypothetical protein [Alteromonas halophila]|uniref:Exonuclease domain-containing protein n=1 Tax=Alteromonas halophila TaxID=516698 RepID=A0A918JH37_9ALTE|nr:hypothetical protein [Alteromonas halophila]GGW81189.1 hypothetical protein GCM10007391_12910 [Alteromonas halophila]
MVSPPPIIDIEASGFGAQSYPIEVGAVNADGERFCRLIRPFPHWQHWDDSAQALHGISRCHLQENGNDARDVCLALNDFLGSQQAYSDGWVVDHPWLIKLYSCAGVAMSFRLSALEYVLSAIQMENWRATRQRIQQGYQEERHRASVDAEIIQQTFVHSAAR